MVRIVKGLPQVGTGTELQCRQDGAAQRRIISGSRQPGPTRTSDYRALTRGPNSDTPDVSRFQIERTTKLMFIRLIHFWFCILKFVSYL
jgi:hypothetical protein